MNLTQLLKDTSNRRVSKAQRRVSAQKLEKRELSGSQSEALTINLLLEEAFRESVGNSVEKNLISLVREYNSNDISGDFRSKIRKLQARLRAREDPPQIRMIVRIILRSYKKRLEEQQGSPPSTPASSDGEDEE